MALFGGNSIFAQQDSIIDLRHGFYKRTHLSLGYNFGIKDSTENKRYHLLEIKFDKLQFDGYHGHSSNWYLGAEVGLNTDKFLVAPKVGGALSYGPIALGGEVVCYTNFSTSTLRLIPFMGLEFHRLRLSLNPHVSLTNKDFEFLNKGHLNITYRLIKLKEEIF